MVILLDMVVVVHYYFDLVDRMLAKSATPMDFRPNYEIYAAFSNDIYLFHFAAQRVMYHVLELLCQCDKKQMKIKYSVLLSSKRSQFRILNSNHTW